ncbi:InlB B-repeat-containing protein [Lagierella sp. ICN-221743]
MLKQIFKRGLSGLLVATMLVTSLPIQSLAQPSTENNPEKKINYDENPISDSGFKEGYINKDIDVKVAKPTDGSKNFIEGPDIPDIYTMRAEYRIQRGDRRINNYQPYEASVGAGIKDEDKEKIEQTINLPDFDGYSTPTPSFNVNYGSIKNKAQEGKKVEKKEGPKTWTEHKGLLPYVYHGKRNSFKVHHIFQSLENKDKYGNMDGETKIKQTTETGLTGSIVTIKPLEDDEIKGYEPERSVIETQMPENTTGYIVEYRYNRKHFNVHYDTKDGSPIATRTIYYGQRIPTIPLIDEKGNITTDQSKDPTYKLGSTFKGWKPSIDLQTKGGKKYNKDEVIKDDNGEPVKTLDLDFIMPADDVTFTAEWKDKEKADYAVQFWVEKADHDDNASLLEKYDYIGTNAYKDKDTGTRPNLDDEPIKGLPFPDLDQARLQKIWNGDKFNRDAHLYLNKFYVYNKKLTDEQNKDPSNPTLVKSVSSTGKTVYNIYFDRQVYTLYFTDSNYFKTQTSDWGVGGQTFFPEIYEPDGKNGAKLVGGKGDPYHFKARFNELMLKWPNDAMQTKGFTPGLQSYGWGPNYDVPAWPTHLDTPPYRLNADEFLDMDYTGGGNDGVSYERNGGYAKKINKGDGTTIDVDYNDFTTISLGIKQGKNSVPHHMDLWMDGYKLGETIIRYDLYRSKADTDSETYEHKYPKVQGFTAKRKTKRTTFLTEDDIDEKNDERAEITPFPDKEYKDIFGFKYTVGQIYFMKAFFNNADNYGDPLDGNEFKKNGYLRFEYTRDKFPLRFNYDPQKTKGDNEFNTTNSIDTFYEFPLKVLSPDLVPNETPREEREYFKENPANFLDNPENLKTLGLTDLVYNDPNDNNKLKVKRPENLPDQMEFKGWALDPAGTKLIWENKDEKMPNHAVNLYAKWGEPDYKWKVTLDPNGGSLSSIKAEDLTKTSKTIQEGDIGQEERKTYPEKHKNDGNKQVFTVIQRQQLKELKEPQRWGYDFLGWEWVRHNADGTEDESYYNEYKVPELYSFGNDVVSDVYLRAIWVRNDLQTVMAYHHILDRDLNEIGEPEPQELPKRRKDSFAAALGNKQGPEYTLVPKAQWEALKQKNKTFERYYNEATGKTNNYFQVHRIEGPLEKEENGKKVEKNNPLNDFHFFYMPYRKREYKVNYLDERCRAEVEKFIKTAKDNFKKNYKAIKNSNKTEDEKREDYRNLVKTNNDYLGQIVSKYSIIDAETVINGKRHYDARNYRYIPGWTLAENESPQQQLFFDVDESTNEFLGINETGLGEIFFFYQDARVIEVKNPKDEVPEGYVRVTFKADKGGSFGKDDKGQDITELYYDVIKGLKWDSIPVPQEWDGLENQKDKDKNYITPDKGKSFVKWDNKPLLNKGTVLQTADKDYYVFTAYFDWSGLTSSGMVRTEAYKDPNGKWTNDFAPKLEDLKKQLVWEVKGKKEKLPDGTDIKFFYTEEGGTEKELKNDDDVFNLVKEMNIEDAKETVRVVNIKAKVKFKDGKETQELDIPITVYKNRYEALTGTSKPLFLSKAEEKEAKDGGLKDILANTKYKRYIKVTVNPTEKIENKDAKVYYVNPNAWVDIPELTWTKDEKDKYSFLKWTADQANQNEDSKKDGIFDFSKRHKFTEDTVITPIFSEDAVEQKGKDKPDVPKTYVKVIVKTTDKATDDTKFEKTFWVNPTKEVTIPVTNPTGKTVEAGTTAGAAGYTLKFSKWESNEKTARVWEDKIVGKFEEETTIVAKYSMTAEKIKDQVPTTGTVDTPKGKTPTVEEIKAKLTPPEGKTISKVTIVENPNVSTPGDSKVTVTVEYTDGSSAGTNDNPIEVPVKVHEPIVKANPDGSKPEGAMKNYVKVTFKAGEGGKFENTLTGEFVYYVSPEVEVDLTQTAGGIKKIPDIGYFVNSEKWNNKDNKTLKEKFEDQETVFKFEFAKSNDIITKTDGSVQKPDGYVTVTFKTDGNGKVDSKDEIIYFVNPKAGIKIGKEATSDNKTIVIPNATANENFTFTNKWQEPIDETTPITNDRTHVAIFEAGKVTLTYKAGEGATGDVPSVVTVNVGETVGLANKGNLAKQNATFTGWKLDGEDKIYQPGDQVKLDKARTATAQWTTVKHTVTFNSKGGTDVESQKVVHGEKLKAFDSPTQKDKVFMGWKEKDKESQQDPYFDLNSAIEENKTLIAQWQDPVQKIGENDKVEEQFIKVTFLKGEHGTLKEGKTEGIEKVTYKVAKDYDFAQAKANGLVVPGIDPAKYYKAKDANEGWDKALELNKQDITFTAQYEPEADVIPIKPGTSDDDIEKERPDGMVLVEFKVPEDKAFMIGESKFYVKKNTKVDIKSPLVRRLELGNGVRNDYVFKGWNLTELDNEWKFSTDTTIKDGAKVKPSITIILPRAGDPEVSVDSMTKDAKAYLEVTRRGQDPVIIEAVKDDDYDMYFFDIPSALGGKLKKRDRIKVYAVLDELRSDTREYRVK